MSTPSPDGSPPREVGVQSFTYRAFDVDGFCEQLSETPITAVELCDVHVTPESDERDVEATLDRLAETDLDVCGYGVVTVDSPDGVDELLSFASRLGANYLSVEFSPDDDETIETLCAAADDYDLDLAIHNHGPDATYATVEDVTAVLDAHSHERLGACVDTGHYLRSGESPDEVIPALGDRVRALHLKDFLDEDTEAVPGQGQLDVGELLTLLTDHTELAQPLVVEYEADPENPTPAVVEAVEEIRQAEVDRSD